MRNHPGIACRPPEPRRCWDPIENQIDELLAESQRQPRKQRYQHAGYSTCYRQRVILAAKARCDAQVDWGEAQVVVDDETVTAQLFVVRLNYS